MWLIKKITIFVHVWIIKSVKCFNMKVVSLGKFWYTLGKCAPAPLYNSLHRPHFWVTHFFPPFYGWVFLHRIFCLYVSRCGEAHLGRTVGTVSLKIMFFGGLEVASAKQALSKPISPPYLPSLSHFHRLWCLTTQWHFWYCSSVPSPPMCLPHPSSSSLPFHSQSGIRVVSEWYLHSPSLWALLPLLSHNDNRKGGKNEEKNNSREETWLYTTSSI